MLASLLPGLRDVRTPLTVGYLWLLTAWIAFGQYFPRGRPSGNGLVAQLFDLGGLLGKAAPIAALSFTAYLLGAILTIPVESRFISRLLGRLRNSLDTRITSREYAQRYNDISEGFSNELAREQYSLSPTDERDLERLGHRAGRESGFYFDANYLRTRLLVANQQLYGEYDRLAAEASFRVNMTPPLMMLGAFVSSDNVFLGLGIMIGAVVLLIQGAIRLNSSSTVLMRAVIANVINDPLAEKIQEIKDRASGQP